MGAKIGKSIRSNIFHFAKNRCASYVIEKALRLCKPEDSRAMVVELLADPRSFCALAIHECGMHVVKAVLKSNTGGAEKAKEILLEEVAQVKSSKYGKRLLDEL